MKAIIFTLTIFHLSFIAIGQPIIILNDKTIGGPQSEVYPTMFFENNQLFAIGGSNTDVGGDKTDSNCINQIISFDFWFVELSDTFNIIFNKSIGGEDNDQPYNFIKSTFNNNLYLSGYSRSDSSCEKSENTRSFPAQDYDFWLVCIDSLHNIVFDKTYGGTGIDSDPKILELASGNLIIMGESSSQPGIDKSAPYFGLSDYWLIKIDQSGNKLWDTSIGGTGREFSFNFYRLDLIALNDNDEFVIAGTTDSPLSGNITTNSIGGKDVIVVKFDSTGNIIWQKRFGGLNHESANSIIKCSDGGFLIGGYTDSPQGIDVTQPPIGDWDAWLLKLDSLGNKIWDKRYGGIGEDMIVEIIKSPEGFYITSHTSSPIGFDISENPYGTSDFWFMEVDTMGNKLWDKRFGGPGWNFPRGCIMFEDSTLMLYGHADSGVTTVKNDPGKGSLDYWMVHFRKDSTTSMNEINDHAINLFPNPTSGIITIPSDMTGSRLTVYDGTGRKVLTNDNVRSTVNLATLDNGLYTLFLTNGNRNRCCKMILMK